MWAEVELCTDEAWFDPLVLRSDKGRFAGTAREHTSEPERIFCVVCLGMGEYVWNQRVG